MQAKRDNLVLIGAFAAAIALHAALLPWVGQAVGDSAEDPRMNLRHDLFDAPSSAVAGQTIETQISFSAEYDGEQLAGGIDQQVFLSRDRVGDRIETVVFRAAYQAVFNREQTQKKQTSEFDLPPDADGPYWLISHLSFVQVTDESDTTDNTRIAPIYIDGPQRPELAIQAFKTPERAAAGGAVLIDFAIDNVGDGWASSNPQLDEHGWADRVYLSADNRLDATDLPLRTFERTSPLGPEGGYRHDAVELELPRGTSGAMHLILVADADQVLDQPSFTQGFQAVPIDLIDTDEPDLVVATITNPPRLVIGRPAPIAFSVANLGSVPTVNSSWLDGIYLSRTKSLDDTAIPLTQVKAGQPLQPRSRYETTVELTLPPDNPSIDPGPWYLVVKADDDNAVHEAVFEDNNTFAVPVEVLTPGQADAEINLGDPERPERLVVQWIEHERIEEHIALRSRTVQPAIQSQAEPDPNAPLVDDPLPPALAATDTATGDPNRPTPLTDPTDPNTNQPPPDASETDVAPRPQTPGSSTQSKIDGLPGDAGALPPKRDGVDGPTTPNLPIDPTPGPNDTPTPDPGDREVPSPADPNAPDTDTTTDSETPAETESETDSNNPEKTETDVTTDNPTEDTTTTPKPDTEEAPKPEGDDGDPATPSKEQTPTRAPKDDSEAPPTDIKITELELQEGKVLVGKGIKITTKLPTPPGTASRSVWIPRNARVSITFDKKGKVHKAEIVRSTTYKEWDAAIEASLYRWTARGDAIDNAKPHVTIEWDYLLSDLFDDE
ncbi:MAG: CARDB domain-containing protein [Planctomycetota bacterium]